MSRPGVPIEDPVEGLIRRCRIGGPKRQPLVDAVTGRRRPPAKDFELRAASADRAAERALSVNIESMLRAHGLPLDYGTIPEKFYAVRLTVGACTALTLEVRADPVDGNPCHGAIWGLFEMRERDETQYERTLDALARACAVL